MSLFLKLICQLFSDTDCIWVPVFSRDIDGVWIPVYARNTDGIWVPIFARDTDGIWVTVFVRDTDGILVPVFARHRRYLGPCLCPTQTVIYLIKKSLSLPDKKVKDHA